jgi:hypothetical protein
MSRIAFSAIAVIMLTGTAFADDAPTAPPNTTYYHPALMTYDQVPAGANRIPTLARAFVQMHFRNDLGLENKPIYFDENGDKHYLQDNHWSKDIYYWTTIDGQSHQFHLKSDGTFPTIAEGLEANQREAERLKAALALITASTHEQCFAQARDTLLDPTSFRVTAQPTYVGNLDRDAFEGMLFSGKIVARNGIGNIAPGVITCGYNLVNGKIVLENFAVGNAL